MKISLKAGKIEKLEADTLHLFLWEDDLERDIKELPSPLSASLRETVKRENFTGTKKDLTVISSQGQVAAYKIILSGLGKKADFTLLTLSEQIARSIKKAKENKAVKIVLTVLDDWSNKFGAKETAQTIVETISLSTYRFLKYKSEEEKNKIREIAEVDLSISPSKLTQAEEGIKIGQITAQATLYCRDLVNEPSQLTTPQFLAKEAVKIAKQSKGLIKETILEEEEIAKLGMNSFLGVAKGSDEKPQFIMLKYKSGRPRKKIVIIGKGITFDTGGLSLKSPEHMETMKLDMAGAAAVLGIFSALSDLKPGVEVIGLIAACENMPSGKAVKPGDILTALNGKTIEVLNTDAEGRLTLADTLSYACKRLKPDEIIDLATLTGACVVALGQDIAGLFGNNEKLLTLLEKASRETGDLVWRMPLEENYRELIKSQIADVKNIQTGRYGGAITAALFLQEFVDNLPWAHLDIAGPAFLEKETPLSPPGGSGFGVRLLLAYINSL